MSMTRRGFLAGVLGSAAVAGLGACSRGVGSFPASVAGETAPAAPAASTVPPGRGTAAVARRLVLEAAPVQWDLGGRVVSTWAYGDTVPGAGFHVTAGERVQIAFTNRLPDATSVHWHGLAINNAMDGVPQVTTPETRPGGTFVFDFVVPDPGTHWFHPHTGLQLDHGLYAPFIVADPAEPGRYDHEWVLVLDDWTDGVGPSPEELMRQLLEGATPGGMPMGGPMGGTPGSGMGMGDARGMGGMSTQSGDVPYSLFLVNGRAATDPDVLRASPGQRVRLRIINAAADTVFAVAVDGHDMSVTHTDGYPVEPTTAQVLLVGMGERYDVTVTLGSGVFPVVAEPLGKSGLARALIRTGAGSLPGPGYRPPQLDGSAVTVGDLRVAAGAALPRRDPDTTQDVVLSGSMTPYQWTINGATYAETTPLTISEGQSGRFRIVNHSMMSHPLHFHGHTFQLGPAGGTGPRKDTLLLPAMAAATIDLAADNPGKWMVHCHNAYHAEAGMMTRLDYTS